jgi:hypothetical protein
LFIPCHHEPLYLDWCTRTKFVASTVNVDAATAPVK